MPFDPKKRMRFVAMLGEEATRKLELGLAAQGRLLEEQGVNWAELGACLGDACPAPAAAPAAPASTSAPAPADAPTSPASAYVNQLQPRTPARAVVAAVAELRRPNADPAAAYVADLAEKGAVS